MDLNMFYFESKKIASSLQNGLFGSDKIASSLQNGLSRSNTITHH